MSKASKKPAVLFYDIETTLHLFYAFSTGKQRLNHTQLLPGRSRPGIICIAYCWNDNKPSKVLSWTPEGGLKKLVQDFDEIINQADFTIGKNSDRFDTKMINACRMLEGLPGIPEWTKYTDDLEKQMRRYFRLPSQSLDYISTQFGLGGKVKMEFNHWVLIDQYMAVQELHKQGMTEASLEVYCQYVYHKSLAKVLREGLEAFKQMCFYCKKDTTDTRVLWNALSKHFDSKWNQSTYTSDGLQRCKHADCGSVHLKKKKKRYIGQMQYQQYECLDCHRYAGRCSVSNISQKEGKIK